MKLLLFSFFAIIFALLFYFLINNLVFFKKASLKINSPKEKLKVYLDGTFLGITPFLKDNLKPGDHHLKISSETFSWEQEVSLTPALATNINLDLGPNHFFTSVDYLSFSPNQKGVVIITRPDSADIILDGKKVGKSPSTFDLSLGNHILSVSKDGYLTREVAFTIEKNYRISCVVNLSLNPFQKISKEETTSKLSLFLITNPFFDLSKSYSDWAEGLKFVQEDLSQGETRFDFLIDNNGKTYILNRSTWENKVVSKSPSIIGILLKTGEKPSKKALDEWSKLKTLFN